MTQAFNHAFALVMALLVAIATLPPEIVDILPAKYKPYVAVSAAAALWLKSHRNLFVNPDGTPAEIAYLPEKK